MRVLSIHYNLGVLGALVSIFDTEQQVNIYSCSLFNLDNIEKLTELCLKYQVQEINVIGPKMMTEHFFKKPIVTYEKEIPIEFIER